MPTGLEPGAWASGPGWPTSRQRTKCDRTAASGSARAARHGCRFGIGEALREDAGDALAGLRGAGLRIVLLSGDARERVAALRHRTGRR